jgi:hypothetical protein
VRLFLILGVSALLVAGSITGAFVLRPPGIAAAVSSKSGLTALFTRDGDYAVTVASIHVAFTGRLNATPTSVIGGRGSDGIGAYAALTAEYSTAGTRRMASIRIYDGRPLALFETRYLSEAANTDPFPVLTSTPALPYQMGYRDSGFAPPTFTNPGVQGPYTAFDAAGDTFTISPAANYMVAAQTRTNGAIAGGIDPTIARLPAGFAHATLLAVGRGINATMDEWGRAIRVINGRNAAGSAPSIVLQKLGYWTDNGATYYYRRAPGFSSEQTLSAVRDEFAAKGVPLGYMQLDSWWYRKDPRDKGMYLYAADPQYVPDGIQGLQHAVALPLVTHARWLAPDSPYRSRYHVSNGVVISPEYYDSVLATTAAAGAVMYEQDWLETKAVPRQTLTDAPALLQAIDQGAMDSAQTVQLCMATPRFFLEAGRWPAITNIRVSTDRFERPRWDAFLYTSELARETGLLPWSDVFMSGETDNLLLSTLSAGLVGVGDTLGHVDAASLLRSVRGDGVIVKPDAPIVPIDSSYIADASAASAHMAPAPMVAATRTDHGGGMVGAYVVAYARGGPTAYSFSPAELGIAGDTYVYDYFAKKGVIVGAGQTYTGDTATGLRYDVVVPVGRSGIAFLGATGNFASLGSTRINAATDDGRVHTTVAFGPTERSVTLAGHSPTRPVVTADGHPIATRWDSGTGIFSANVPVQTNGIARVVIAR